MGFFSLQKKKDKKVFRKLSNADVCAMRLSDAPEGTRSGSLLGAICAALSQPVTCDSLSVDNLHIFILVRVPQQQEQVGEITG